MNKTIEKQLKTAGKNLESVIKLAKRRVFEFETLVSAYEVDQGKIKQHTSAKSLIRSVKKGR